MEIFIQVNAYFLLQLLCPTPVQADFKVNFLPFFYFPFLKFPLVSFLKSPMNYLPLSSKKLPFPDFVKYLFPLEFFPTSCFVYPSWWYCFWNPCCNISSHFKIFTPFPLLYSLINWLQNLMQSIQKACLWNDKGWWIMFSCIMR